MINRRPPVWIQWLLGQYGRSPAALARRDAAAQQTTAIFLTDQNPWECTGHHVPYADETGFTDEALALGLDLDAPTTLPDVETPLADDSSAATSTDTPSEERPHAVNE